MISLAMLVVARAARPDAEGGAGSPWCALDLL